jgi:HYR domain-containing protein/galactose oxidase-like protein/FIMAH domain-containing protein
MKTVRHLVLPMFVALGLLSLLLELVVPIQVAHASDTWTLTGSLNIARLNHTATLLPNSKVLVAGGEGGGTSAELYDPSTGSWTSTASMSVGVGAHTATLLPNGQVLVAAGGSGVNGNTAVATAELFTLDTTAPTLSLPGTITVNATSPSGAVVTYTVSASDPDDPASQLTIHCTPASGSTFPIGTTTVNCTANDPSGNTASGSFQVVVTGAVTQVNNLINLVNSFHLAHSLQNSLDAKLQDVLTALNAGQTATACSELTDFIGIVQSQSGRGLTASQANQLIAAAQQIKAVLGC